jgi:hypothetical protein
VIETKDLHKDDFEALRDRVHDIISRPIEEALEKPQTSETLVSSLRPQN